jgi:hypothetical protein
MIIFFSAYYASMRGDFLKIFIFAEYPWCPPRFLLYKIQKKDQLTLFVGKNTFFNLSIPVSLLYGDKKPISGTENIKIVQRILGAFHVF